MMRAQYPLLLATALLPWWSLTAAESIYKSVDAQGNVTYSSTPPASGTPAQPMNIPGVTQPQDPAVAEQQRHQAEQGFALRQKERKEQKEAQAKALKDAEQRREQARRDLTAASRPKDKATGSTERSPGTDGQTAAQTAKEQRALREAERALRDVKQGKLPPKPVE